MVHIKSNSFKFVFFLLCLSQIQACTEQLFEKTDNPFDELFREVSNSVIKFSVELQLRLTEADVNVDKYFENLKENIEYTYEQFQEILPMVQESVGEFEKQISDVVQQQIERVSKELITEDPEIGEKIKKIKAELADFKEDLTKLYGEIKKLFLKHYNEFRSYIIIRTKPIVNRWTPIIKDIEEIFLVLNTKKKEEIKKTNE